MLNTGVFAPVYRWLAKRRAEPAVIWSTPPRQLVTVHSLKMRLDTSEAIQNTMVAGSYEPEQTAWTRECLLPGDRFVDVGASFGWYTGLASTLVGPTGSVVAFEPSPVASSIIGDTIAENQLNNVTLVRAAVGTLPGHEHIHMPMDGAVHSPSVFASDGSFVPLQVPLISLDRYEPFTDGSIIKLIKIDVEGYEQHWRSHERLLTVCKQTLPAC